MKLIKLLSLFNKHENQGPNEQLSDIFLMGKESEAVSDTNAVLLTNTIYFLSIYSHFELLSDIANVYMQDNDT